MVSVEFEVKSVSEFTLELTCWLASVELVMVAVEPSEDEKFG